MSETDLTGRARIRNSALELFADRGVAATSMRHIAEHAGVTVGLVTHHFGTKENLRRAVDDYVVERYRDVLSGVPVTTDHREYLAARDRAVTQMLQDEPGLQDYLRQMCLHPSNESHDLLERLIDFGREEVRRLRAFGVLSEARTEEEQVLIAVVRQLGALLLHPLLDRSWRHLGGRPECAPLIEVSALSREPVLEESGA